MDPLSLSDDIGDPEQRRRMLDFQGRKVRELMEGRGLTIAGLAEQSGVDIVDLVAILFGLIAAAFYFGFIVMSILRAKS